MTAPERITKGLYWDEAWSLVGGCTHVSPGCDHCWSAAETHMRAGNPNEKIKARNEGLTDKFGCFNGQIRLNYDFLAKPLRRKKPTVYAVWNDLFHEDVDGGFLCTVFDTMAAAKQHTFLILTKRPGNMLEFYKRCIHYTPQNIWLGVTAENQEQADRRIPILLQIPAAVRWVSVEPMLGPIDLQSDVLGDTLCRCAGCLDLAKSSPDMWQAQRIDWVVCGGESGPGARPMHPEWARSLRDQCQGAGVPFFFKQWGEWADCTHLESRCNGSEDYIFSADGTVLGAGCKYGGLLEENWEERGGAWMSRVGKKKAGRELDGRTWDEFPEVR